MVHNMRVSAFAPLSSITLRQAPRASAPLSAVAANGISLPNPFKKLPWNIRREQERQARRLKQERATLHRELGIAEDATYEEIVEATDLLIAQANDNIKRKIQIEVAKDKILQIRLNERLAGLAEVNKDARAQSIAEERYVCCCC